MTTNNIDALFADAELPFGHPGRRFDYSPAGYSDFDDRYEPPPVDPPEEDVVHYGPATGPSAATSLPLPSTPKNPTRWPAAKTVWSSSPRTCRTRTPSTGAIASTADGRSPPPAPSSGAGWSDAHARTAEGLGGNEQQGPQ